MALSESERDYYYNNRAMMEYLGNKDGVDVYRDPYSGQFCKCARLVSGLTVLTVY